MKTKEKIISIADRLFYENGFEHTSFADIAAAVNISRGNFYYHFKTKDDILNAVIDLRKQNTQALLQQWEAQSDAPIDRIRSYINIVATNKSAIKEYGCPVGTLCTELSKLNHISEQAAASLFTLFQTWLARQFCAMGFKNNTDFLALHVLGWSQGVATLFNTFKNEAYLKQELEQMNKWLSDLSRTLPTHKEIH